MTSRYAIAYDVSSDQLRRQIRRTCRRYGAHQQYSLFEVRLTSTERAEIIEEFRDLVADADDPVHIRIYSVGPEANDIDIPEVEADEEPANIV